METLYTESKQSERKYRRLARMGQELQIPITECFLQMDVLSPDGEILHSHKQRSHSWNRNFYTMLFDTICGKDTNDTTTGAGKTSLLANSYGSIRVVNYGLIPAMIYAGGGGQYQYDGDAVSGCSAGIRAPVANSDFGILVGSGTDAEDFEGWKLSTQILNGNATGQLSHQASNPHMVSYDTPTKTLSDLLIRFFNNNSGGDILVNETALVYAIGAFGTFNTMFGRDLLSSTVTVPDAGQLKVAYTISLVFPA